MKHRAKLTDDWLPIPDAMLAALGWQEGTLLDVDIAGDCIVLSKAGDQKPVPKPAPAPRRAKL